MKKLAELIEEKILILVCMLAYDDANMDIVTKLKSQSDVLYTESGIKEFKKFIQ